MTGLTGPKKVDWTIIKSLYVTEGLSARELARRFGLSNGTVSARVRKEDWEGEKIVHHKSIERRSYEKVAETVASESAAIKNESVLAARLYLRKFIEQVNAGQVSTDAKGAAVMIQLLTRDLASPEGMDRSDTPTIIEVNNSGDTDALKRLLEVARERRTAPRDMGSTVLGSPQRSRPN
jgi:hypothetical protein